MALPRFIQELNEVDEALRNEYVKTDDGFVLDVVGDDEVKTKLKKLDEFRTNNRRLHSETEELRKKLELVSDIDRDKYEKAIHALDRIEGDEERRLIEEGEFDEVIKRRTAAMQNEFKQQMAAKDEALKREAEEKERVRQRLAHLDIDQGVIATANKAQLKVRQGALPDLLARAHQTWRIDEQGRRVALDVDGKTRKFGKDSEPLTLDEWLLTQATEAPHLFEPGSGGGSEGSTEARVPGKKVLPTTVDPLTFGNNLESIAKGDVTVGDS